MPEPLLLRLSLAAVLLVAAIGSAGCFGSGDEPATAAAAGSGEPQRGGTLTIGIQQEPTCLDPHVNGDMPQASIAAQYTDSLVSIDEDGKIGPWLATSWEVSPDGRTYTFELRDDVKFHDGTAFDAAALKANLDHMVDPKTQSGTAGSYLKPYVKTRVVDADTAEVVLDRPYSALLEVLSQSFLGIQSPTALARSQEENCTAPVGSGPFKVESYAKKDRVVLVRNEEYTSAPPTAEHEGPAYVDKIVWRFIPEPSVRFAALQSGEVDVIDELPPESEAPAERDKSLALVQRDRPGNPTHISLNVKQPVFADVRVRKAFIQSADIESGLKSAFFGARERAGGPLSHVTNFYDERFETAHPFDPAAAGALLDEAGWTERDGDGYRVKDGERLTVRLPYPTGTGWPTKGDIALYEQIQATQKEVGIDLRLEPLDSNTFFAGYAEGDYDATPGYWNTNTADVLRIVFSTEAQKSAGYRPSETFFSDPELDRILDEALAEQDEAKRGELYLRAQQIVSDAALQIGTYPQSTRLAARAGTGGVRLEPSLGVTYLYDAWVTP